MARWPLRLAWVAAACAQLGCVALLPAPKPVPTLQSRAGAGTAKCLVIFLPGALDRASTFRNEGFFELLKQRHLSVDAIAVNATIGYYAKGRVVTRLEEDVMTPTLARGYGSVWLIGASMGGLGTFLYSRLHADQITGIYAIAPFLGDPELSEEITRAGGLRAWPAPPPAAPMTQANYQREVWRWLQALTGRHISGPELYLGYGASDRLAPQDGVLAAELAPDHVFHAEGGHDWGTWHKLFADFLDRSDFQRSCR